MSDNKQELRPANQRLYGVLGEYSSVDALKEGCATVRDAGYGDDEWDSYSPFPIHGIEKSMGITMTRLPLLVFAVGFTGGCLGLLLQYWTNAVDYAWIVSGKPFFSLPANIPITFETTILLSAFATFFGMWAFNKLPQVWHPLFKKDRFSDKVTQDGFFISIETADEAAEAKAKGLLEQGGATAIETVYVADDPAARKLPRLVVAFMILSATAAILPFAYAVKARHTKSDQPHWHIFADMDFQFKAKAQTKVELDEFADDRGTRAHVDGTVARGELRADDHFFRGIAGGAWATELPRQVEASDETLARGRQKFDTYCAPCHGASGFGNGLVNLRAEQLGSPKWVTPSSLHQEYVVKLPHGQLFNTITNGVRSMRGYASQIEVADRWAIVLYVRALQRSQKTNIDDVPPDARNQLR